MTSELIEPGKFRGKTACCLAGVLCLPAALAAGTTDGFIVVTYSRDTGTTPSIGQSPPPLLRQGKSPKRGKPIVPTIAIALAGVAIIAGVVSHFEDKDSEAGPSDSAQPTVQIGEPNPPVASTPTSTTTTAKAPGAVKAIDSQKRAIALYPDLAVAGSPLNREFLRRYNALKASGDPILQKPDWPEKLVKQSFDAVSSPSKSP